MTTRSLSAYLRRALLCLCLGLSLAVVTLPARADDPPKFSAPEVNDFVKKFSGLMDEYIKAMKAKDEAKMKELDAKGKDLETASATVESKLKPEEAEAFAKFMAAQAQRMMDAAQEAAK